MENKKAWTIMVYMAGDNNLSIDMAYSLKQIKDFVKGNKNINLFVYYDGYSPAVPTLYCDFSGADDRVYFRSRTAKDKLYPPRRTDDNENSASAYSVINFVDWCVNKVEYTENGTTFNGRKAEKYAFIFSGHTSGFHSIGLLRDEKSNYYMTMPKVKWLFERITKTKAELEDDLKEDRRYRVEKGLQELTNAEIERGTSEIIGQKLAFLGFDSCLMGMYEVAYQFKSVAETMVASQGSIPNAGWTYTNLLGNLTKIDPNRKNTEIAKDFVFDFITTQDSYTIGGVTVDMAAWDLSLLEKVEEPFETLVDNLIECFRERDGLIYKQMRRVLLETHWGCQSYMFEQNIDLGDFCFLLKKELESLSDELGSLSDAKFAVIIESCRRIIEGIRECVILSGFSGGDYQYSNGIALFFPWSFDGYNVSRQNYEALHFVKATEAGKKWVGFLETYLGDVTLRPGKTPGLRHSPDAFAAADIDGNKPVSYSNYIYKNEKVFLCETETDEECRNVKSEDRTTVNAENRTTVNAENRTTVNAENRTTVNAENRTTVNAENRTTVNAENRMFGNLNVFFEQLFRFKNIETQWNISGFSKQPAHSKPHTGNGDLSAANTGIWGRGEVINKNIDRFLEQIKTGRLDNRQDIENLINMIQSESVNSDNQ